MNFDVRKNTETQGSIPSIESRISRVMKEIEKEFSFQGNTLESLITFKLEKQKQFTIENSIEYKNALIQEIKSKADSGKITPQNETETFNQAKYEALASKIIQINKLTGEIQGEIQKLRADFLKDSLKNFQIGTNDFITKKWYKPETLVRIENPKNFSDEIEGFGISAVESIVTFGKLGYDVMKGVFLSPYHLLKILSGKAKYDGVEI